MGNLKNIPELRFPEFENEGEWEEKKISDLGETISGLTGKSGEDFGTGKPFVTYKQVFDNSVIDFEKCGKVQVGKNENQNLLQRGDILFTTSSETPNEVGFASVLIDSPKEETYLNSFCFALRPFNIEKTQPQFSRYLFHSPVYRKSVTAIAQGSTRYNLSKGAFLELQVPVPSPKEQQKIASCLSSLDDLIESHSQKLELLKNHKKGLMQNLFPQEGEKVPKLRFKEFEKDGEWVKKTLGEVCINIASGKDKSEYNGEYELFGSTGIIGKTNSASYKGDYILVARVGANAGYLNRVNSKFGVTDNTLVVSLKKTQSIGFIYYTLENFGLNKLIFGSGQPLITGGQLKNLELFFPTNPKEQKKIASCLSSLDELIIVQTKKIEQLKLHKKGLMQGLFPKID